ncbi:MULTISPECIES: hypothetical protein [unclassified Streptomyces]|nr:hypothetical protein [Streptomyces sp. Root1310]
MRVWILEDEPEPGTLVAARLRGAGPAVDLARPGSVADPEPGA